MEATQFTIGSEAICTDGACGEVTQVVVDPVAKAVTHLVVEPKHRSGLGRLVPLDLVDAGEAGEAGAGELHQRCTRAEFDHLASAEETHFLPGSEGYAGYDDDQVLSWPYFGGNVSPPVTVDTLPVGEVAVRRGEQVHATDGPIGQVQGLVIDTASRHVTHVLLQEGHLWGRKEVAIPIAAVVDVEDGIRLNLSKRDVEDLPGVDIARR
jgi:sporulation protein YlmC with PRC-barrel domain